LFALVKICHLYISPRHNFVGHHGREPDDNPVIEVSMIECVAGRGIRGDRYFDFKDDYKGQITFFSIEVFDALRGALEIRDCSPALVRRNVVTRDVDLNDLIGQDFEVQGIRFHGTQECSPCYWMDRAIAPGTQDFLKGRGGLRARILEDGKLLRLRGFPYPLNEH
jgi:MOSC domain-containing protein YiiM